MSADSPSGQVIPLPQPRKTGPGRSATRVEQDPKLARSTLHEALPGRTADASATALILSALSGRSRPILWVQDRMSRQENGRLHLGGRGLLGVALQILRVEVSHPRDVLWAMEEGAACAGLGGVVGEIHGAPAVLDFTATKRLALRAEASGVPVWLIRSGDPGTLSAARTRWRIAALPSARHPDDAGAPGAPLWDAELFRAQGRAPGRWRARHEPDAADPQDRLRLVSPSGDGPLESGGAAGQDAAGA